MKITKRITRVTTIQFDGEQLTKVLNLTPEGAIDVKVYVDIPTGGNYAGMRLEIGPDFPLVLEYTEVE